MLPKKQRFPLRKERDFFQRSRKVSGSFFVLYVQHHSHGASKASQGAVIVPKKVAALATQRNKIKRWVKTILSPTLQDISELAIVVYIKRSFEKENLTELEQKLLQLKTKN
jgi:ribonuclease P protein component